MPGEDCDGLGWKERQSEYGPPRGMRSRLPCAWLRAGVGVHMCPCDMVASRPPPRISHLIEIEL
jgi:hypothetical protein